MSMDRKIRIPARQGALSLVVIGKREDQFLETPILIDAVIGLHAVV